MEKNVGKTDKMIRYGAAVIFAVLGYTVHWAFHILAIALAFTATTGFCLLYKPFGINTNKNK